MGVIPKGRKQFVAEETAGVKMYSLQILQFAAFTKWIGLPVKSPTEVINELWQQKENLF